MEAEIRAQIPGIDHVVSEYSAVGESLPAVQSIRLYEVILEERRQPDMDIGISQPCL